MSLMSRMDERMNPVLLTQLRVLMRGKIMLFAVLLYMVIMMITVVGSAPSNWNIRRSDHVQMLLSFLAFSFVIVLPTLNGLMQSGSKDNLELISLTRLRPAQIARGQLGMLWVQYALLLMMSLPFVVMIHYFGGMDLSLFYALLGLASLVGIAFSHANFWICGLTLSSGWKQFLCWSLVPCQITLFAYIVSWNSFNRFDRDGVVILTLTVLVVIAALYFWLCALHTSVHANRALPVRFYTVFCVTVGG